MLQQTIEAHELLDDARADGDRVADHLARRGITNVTVTEVVGPRGRTQYVKVIIDGMKGLSSGGPAPTLGIIGSLGGLGARPHRTGLVSDADGAMTATACALKLADMQERGDNLVGDVICVTHVCPDAPLLPHEPVPFMDSPADTTVMLRHEVDPAMTSILSVDATKANRLLHRRGLAITPTVKEGYVLRVSDDLLDIMEWTTGMPPMVLPITTQDITPYDNGVFHINAMMQPCTMTNAPVVGVAITAEGVVPGCCTGANHEVDIEGAARYCIEIAKSFTSGTCRFYDAEEFARLVELYGQLNGLQG